MQLEAGKVHPIFPIALLDGAPDNSATFGQIDYGDNPLIVTGPALDLTNATPGETLEITGIGLVNYSDGSSRTERFVSEVQVMVPATPAPTDVPAGAAGAPMPSDAPANADTAVPVDPPLAVDPPAPAHEYGASFGFN